MRRVLVALLFLIAMTLAACAPTMDEVGARKAALTYWTTLPREAGSHLKDGHVTGAKPSTHDGHAGWEIVVDGAVVVPASEGGPISACTWSSEKWQGRAPDDVVLLRMFVRDEGSATSLPRTDLVAAARADAERTLQIGGEPLLVRVSRWDGAMPRYTVGHLDRVAAIEAAVTAWPAVTVAGASYRGVGLPDCVTQGQAAASRIGEWLGTGAPAPRAEVGARA